MTICPIHEPSPLKSLVIVDISLISACGDSPVVVHSHLQMMIVQTMNIHVSTGVECTPDIRHDSQVPSPPITQIGLQEVAREAHGIG